MLPGDSDVVYVVDPPGSIPDQLCRLFLAMVRSRIAGRGQGLGLASGS